MKIYLAAPLSYLSEYVKANPKYCLETFYELKKSSKKKEFFDYINTKEKENFLLDSGAFTFLNSGTEINFDNYVKEYAKFIKENNIKQYFEMDIDSIVGLKKVEEYRNFLEEYTKTKCIPVWHKSRGIKYLEMLTKQYNFIAIGGFAIKVIKKNEYKYINSLIDIAHKNNCKVHGLGFTSLKDLEKYKFDTVDSTSWKSGMRYGNIQKWNNIINKLETIKKPKNSRCKINHKILAAFSLQEWKKFVRHMEGITCIK
jgi:hypothetical protein